MTIDQAKIEEIKAVRNVHIVTIIAVIAVAVTISTLFFYSVSTLSDKISVESLAWFFGIVTLLCLLGVINAGSGGFSLKIDKGDDKEDDKEDEEEDDDIVVGATREEIQELMEQYMGPDITDKDVDKFIDYLDGDVTDWVKDNAKSYARDEKDDKNPKPQS